MAEHGNLLWVEKCYFSGWTCSECLWRIAALSRHVGYHIASCAFDTHDCLQNQPTRSRATLVTRLKLGDRYRPKRMATSEWPGFATRLPKRPWERE
jgi:hypothetical protein